MKFPIFVALSGLLALVSANCGCSQNKLKVLSPKHHNYGCDVEVLYRGEACQCQRPIPYRVEVPKEEKCEKLKTYGYAVEKPTPVPRAKHYVWNTRVERPKETKGPKCGSSYPVRVEVLREQKPTKNYIYNTQVHHPTVDGPERKLRLTARLDRVVLPRRDCIDRPCRKSCSDEDLEVISETRKPSKNIVDFVRKYPKDLSSEEDVKVTIKKTKKTRDSSEEEIMEEYITEEIENEIEHKGRDYYKCNKKGCKKVHGSDEDSSEEIILGSDETSEVIQNKDSSEEDSDEVIKKCKCKTCKKQREESEEVIKPRCKKPQESSEEELLEVVEKPRCNKPQQESSEEMPCKKIVKKSCRRFESESSEELPYRRLVKKPCHKVIEESSEELPCRKVVKKPCHKVIEESSEELPCRKVVKKPCHKVIEESSEETFFPCQKKSCQMKRKCSC